MTVVVLEKIKTQAKDRRGEIQKLFDDFVRNLEQSSLTNNGTFAIPFSLASLRSTKNDASVSAEDDFQAIMSDIQLLREEVEKYTGPRNKETPASKMLDLVGERLKFKLDNRKFDIESWRPKRKDGLKQVEFILKALSDKIQA